MKLLYKYFLMVAVPLVICLCIIGTGLSFQMYNYSVSEKHNTLDRAANRVSILTKELLENYTVSREKLLRTIIKSMTEEGKIHVIICDNAGQVIITSDNYGSRYIGSYIGSDVLEKTRYADRFSSVGTLGGIYSGQNYSVGLPVRSSQGEIIAYTYVTTSIDNVSSLMMYVINLFLFLSVLVFIFTAFASYFIVKRMTRPLKQIADASKKFAMGDFKTRVPVQSKDEIGELTVAFNNMADSLEKSEDLRRTFVANVSHEFRSPMTSIGGFVDGILDGTIPREREEHYLRIVSSEVHRLSRLVSRMLDITVLQGTDITAQSVRFDFSELCRRAALSFEKRLNDNGISLLLQVPDSPITVFANEDAIYQVVYNLIDNAIKFSENNSTIEISISEKRDIVTFSVKNFGVEIPKEQLLYVFDRFHKGDSSRSKDKTGLGLGLYIAKTIINQHKGKIWAESRDGYTEFFFTLPRKVEQNS